MSTQPYSVRHPKATLITWLFVIASMAFFMVVRPQLKIQPTLKSMIALATVKREYSRPGTRLQFEITVEAVRHHVRATVVKTPFFNPKRKTATPVV